MGRRRRGIKAADADKAPGPLDASEPAELERLRTENKDLRKAAGHVARETNR